MFVRRMAVIILLALSYSCGQQTWEETMQAGETAFQHGQYGDAERIFAAAVKKADQFGPHDRRAAVSLSRLAQAYAAQSKFVEAEPLYLQALAIYQDVYGENHLDVAVTLNNLGVLHRKHGQYADAKRLLTRALEIKERVLGPENPEIALALTNLATLHLAQREWASAVTLLERALVIREKQYGRDHPEVAKILQDYAGALRQLGRDSEARAAENRAAALRKNP